MAALALTLAMFAADPAAAPVAAPAPGPTFCERMAKPYKMGRASGTKEKVWVGRLRADKGSIGYRGQVVVEGKSPCDGNLGSARCVMGGPGELTVSSARIQLEIPPRTG